jgi:hypothetical protein
LAWKLSLQPVIPSLVVDELVFKTEVLPAHFCYAVQIWFLANERPLGFMNLRDMMIEVAPVPKPCSAPIDCTGKADFSSMDLPNMLGAIVNGDEDLIAAFFGASEESFAVIRSLVLLQFCEIEKAKKAPFLFAEVSELTPVNVPPMSLKQGLGEESPLAGFALAYVEFQCGHGLVDDWTSGLRT